MMTLDALNARLAGYLAAETEILKSQEYSVGQGSTARRNRRADLEQVRAGIKEVSAEIAVLQASSGRGRRVIYLRPYG